MTQSSPTAAPSRDAEARLAIRARHRMEEGALVRDLARDAGLDAAARAGIVERSAAWVRALRRRGSLGLMESVLAEYGLSSEEGLALMTLAEAFLRVPDGRTADALVADKVGPGDWAEHIGHSASRLVNGSTLGLALTGRVLAPGEARGVAARATQRLGAPVIRAATRAAMREMGRQFVLGRDIAEALARARPMERRGALHSYDMLGEAAMTRADADAFHASYAGAIAAVSEAAGGRAVREAPGVSVKLSALHPRYEWAQRDRVMAELVPRVASLARAAAAGGIGLNVDAEEQGRLELSLDVFEAVLRDPALAGWDGLGFVVQAYGKRAMAVIDWLDALAARHDRRIMVRLVKGAYWDGEIKLAQTEGLEDFPVLTAKAATDVSFLACARRLLAAPRLHPQFATHNAHTIAAILHMAEEGAAGPFELQRLHGMGAALHAHVAQEADVRTRVYAPVGRHRELLAYLVRRLLENGANSSFVNRLADASVPAEEVVSDPFPRMERRTPVAAPPDLFAPRANARGWDLDDPVALEALDAARAPWRAATWEAAPILAGGLAGGAARPVLSPADPGDVVGRVIEADAETARRAVGAARPWDAPPAARAATLEAAAALFEDAAPEIFALLAREAGKTLPDAVAELREAVDFLNFYAAEIRRIDPEGARSPRGTILAISPWNFPLAIFTGQVAAALAAGNAVIAKPAEPTPLIAALGTRLMHRAGVPRGALQLLPGEGGRVGAALAGDAQIAGTVFTGSTATARAIDARMAEHLDPHAMLVAETGGINAMIVDSTALPEQAVRDVVASAFRSAGQRCSACRLLLVQSDIAEPFLRMLRGAMDELRPGHPWERETDLGPLISEAARAAFAAHVEAARAEGRVIHEGPLGGAGHAFAPTLLRVDGPHSVREEVFGPILHVATFGAGGALAAVREVNALGYGLTMGLHTRIEAVADAVRREARVGNLYVNRNQIGAIVGSQPFGGEGLSGTGPKAGGPAYVERFLAPRPETCGASDVAGRSATAADLDGALASTVAPAGPLSAVRLPGPTGERNVLSERARGPVLCLGPGAPAARAQAAAVRARGGVALAAAPDLAPGEGLRAAVPPGLLTGAAGLAAVMHAGPDGRAIRRALAARPGPIVPLLTEGEAAMSLLERHVCTDTTAAGGNATLLSAAPALAGLGRDLAAAPHPRQGEERGRPADPDHVGDQPPLDHEERDHDQGDADRPAGAPGGPPPLHPGG